MLLSLKAYGEESSKPSAPKVEMVKCYGIADKGKSENPMLDVNGKRYSYGAAPPCHPMAYITLPKNGIPCENIVVGISDKRIQIKGSLTPNANRPAFKDNRCWPFDRENQRMTFPHNPSLSPNKGVSTLPNG